jgi:hypothetical protein
VALMTQNEKNLIGAAIVMESGGIKSTILRAATNTILLASRHKHARMFSEMDAAAQWLSTRLKDVGLNVTPQRVLEDARRLMGGL